MCHSFSSKARLTTSVSILECGKLVAPSATMLTKDPVGIGASTSSGETAPTTSWSTAVARSASGLVAAASMPGSRTGESESLRPKDGSP